MLMEVVSGTVPQLIITSTVQLFLISNFGQQNVNLSLFLIQSWANNYICFTVLKEPSCVKYLHFQTLMFVTYQLYVGCTMSCRAIPSFVVTAL